MSQVSDKTTAFFGSFPEQQFQKGQIILSAGENPASVIFLKSGFLRQFQITQNGKELTNHFYKPGSFLPLSWLINNQPNIFFIEAQTSTICHLAPKEKVQSFISENPDVLMDIISRLLFALEGMTTRINSLSNDSAEEKIAGILEFLRKHFGKKLTAFTHEDIAKLTGLTRETVSRELEKLQKQGKIKQEKHELLILD